MSNYLEKYWLIIVAFLLVSILTGGIILAVKQSSHRPVEITLLPASPLQYDGDIYIGGAVANPGLYPLRQGDTIESLIQTAGLAQDADTKQIELYVPKAGELSNPQKIDLNRAEVWLLDALPGIGPGRAQAIVDYRNQNGPFRIVEDLLNIQGIGESTLDEMRDFITVKD
jgi:competence protein ComEA